METAEEHVQAENVMLVLIALLVSSFSAMCSFGAKCSFNAKYSVGLKCSFSAEIPLRFTPGKD